MADYTKVNRAKWALRNLKAKHGRDCKCAECVKWMMAIANSRRKAKYG